MKELLFSDGKLIHAIEVPLPLSSQEPDDFVVTISTWHQAGNIFLNIKTFPLCYSLIVIFQVKNQVSLVFKHNYLIGD